MISNFVYKKPILKEALFVLALATVSYYSMMMDQGIRIMLTLHLYRGGLNVGTHVNQGDVLGVMGMTGCATGDHLHFELSTVDLARNYRVPGSTVINSSPNSAIQYSYDTKKYGNLDVNGFLDEEYYYSLGSFATANVYICTNGANPCNSVYATQQADYAENLPAGTTYKIVITPNDGYAIDYTKDTSNTYSGTIAADQKISIEPHIKPVILEVKSTLDGKTCNNCGTFDVVTYSLNSDASVSNEKIEGNDVTSWNKRMTYFKGFEIRDIKPGEGIEYVGCLPYNGGANPSGRLDAGTTTVTLQFVTKAVDPTCEWTESSYLPKTVTTDNSVIEYKNTYTKSSPTSPGSGWTKVSGSQTTKYEATGEYLSQPYPADGANSTTLVLVDRYYYHYCAENGVADYWQHNQYQHRGQVIRPDNVDPVSAIDVWYRVIESGKDTENKNVTWYRLQWTAEGTAATGWTNNVWCGDGLSRDWYLNYVYEKRQAVTYYTWMKESDWASAPDSSAHNVTYRFKLKNCDPISRTVTFKVANGSWNDGTTANKTVKLEGYEGDTLKLAASQIPAVGSKPNTGYQAGSWNKTPSASTAITANTTYTFTYDPIPVTYTATFKVVNGSWDDGTTADKTVTLNGTQIDAPKLTAEQIPAVGSKPNAGFTAGTWDKTLAADTAITENTTFTYTYAVDADDSSVKLIVSSTKARPGEEVTVGVSIENNPGINGIYFLIDIDEAKLRFSGCEDSGLENWGIDPTSEDMAISWFDSAGTNYNGEIVKLKFTVLEDAEEGDAIINLLYTDGDFVDTDENWYLPVFQSGKVNIYKYMPGDIDGNGKVNMLDMVRLNKYILNKSTPVFANPDTDGNGKVNMLDMVRLNKYILNKSVEIH